MELRMDTFQGLSALESKHTAGETRIRRAGGCAPQQLGELDNGL